MKKFLFVSALLLSSLSYADDINNNPVNNHYTASDSGQPQKQSVALRRLKRALAACAGGTTLGIVFPKGIAMGVPAAGLLFDGANSGLKAIDDTNDYGDNLERAFSVWGPAIACAFLTNYLLTKPIRPTR